MYQVIKDTKSLDLEGAYCYLLRVKNMHAYLIIGTNPDAIEEKIKELTESFKAKTLTFPLAKIDDARALNSFLNLTISAPTAITINSIDKATEEAANAFLKNLEEPQKDLYFFLTAESIHKVLSTISSRCQIIKISQEEKGEHNSKITKFLEKSVGEKLKEIDQIRDREEAKLFVRELINNLHLLLHQDRSNLKNIADNLEISQKTLGNLEANGNVSLQLSNLSIKLN